MIKNFIPKDIKNQQIFVGFSGGADSLALLLKLYKKLPQKITAVHFNHNLRHNSINDEFFCQEICKKFNIPLQIYQLNVIKNQKSNETTEMAARRLRQQTWEKIANNENIIIALGHHQDDLFENFFIRLMRGSGSSGLCGISEFFNINGVNYWRPNLGTNKKSLQNFLLQEFGIKNWCEDETNSENVYRRNQIRNQLLPIYQQIAGTFDGLETSLKILKEEGDFLDKLAEKHFVELQQKSYIATWQKIEKILLHRVLRKFLSNIFGEDIIPNGKLVERFYSQIHSFNGEKKIIPISGTHKIFISKTEITSVDIKDFNKKKS